MRMKKCIQLLKKGVFVSNPKSTIITSEFQLHTWKVNSIVSRALFIVDEAGKMVSEDGTEVTVEGAVEDQEVEKDEDGQEVIKVYIFKADSGEDDMGELD